MQGLPTTLSFVPRCLAEFILETYAWGKMRWPAQKSHDVFSGSFRLQFQLLVENDSEPRVTSRARSVSWAPGLFVPTGTWKGWRRKGGHQPSGDYGIETGMICALSTELSQGPASCWLSNSLTSLPLLAVSTRPGGGAWQ